MTFKQPYFDSFYSCFEATDGKSCHIEGATRFFGEELNQELDLTSGELAFGQSYRFLAKQNLKVEHLFRAEYAKLIRGEETDLKTLTEAADIRWNVVSYSSTAPHYRRVFSTL